MADRVLPGLKPYQPNHRMTPPTAAMVRSCGRVGAAAVAFELAPEARPEGDGAGEGDEAADGVHDGRAGEVMERGVPGVDGVASQPSGPQAQWPMIG